MAFQITTFRRAAPASLIFAAVVATACIEVSDASDDAAKRTADSGGGAVFIGDPKPNAPTPSPDTYGADSATPVRGFGPTELDAALRTDTTHTLEVIDSTPAAQPTSADLGVLERELTIPVAGVARSALRDTYDEMRGGTRRHEALDIIAPRGTTVLSAAPGRVLKLFNSKPGGLMVYAADSSERFILMYGHLDAYAPGLAEGQTLRRGQPLGTVGTTGNAPPTVPHLHFAVARSADVKQWWKGMPVNPYPMLK
jgi:peptidoglycan LD-endopeptidase LytH